MKGFKGLILVCLLFTIGASSQVSRAATIEKTGCVISDGAHELNSTNGVYAFDEVLIISSYGDVTNLPSAATLVTPFDLSLDKPCAVTEPVKRTYGYAFIRLFHWRCQKK